MTIWFPSEIFYFCPTCLVAFARNETSASFGQQYLIWMKYTSFFNQTKHINKETTKNQNTNKEIELLQLLFISCKGLGLGRVKTGPVKIAKFQSLKIIDMLSFLIYMSELWSFRNFLNFDTVSILKHVVWPQSNLVQGIFAFFGCFWCLIG